MSHNHTKDLPSVAGTKEWSGDTNGKSVRQYFEQIECFVKVSHWTEHDMALIAKAKLQGLALQFVNGREELLKDTCPYVATKRGSRKKCLTYITVPNYRMQPKIEETLRNSSPIHAESYVRKP
jgi:hypothetical protein